MAPMRAPIPASTIHTSRGESHAQSRGMGTGSMPRRMAAAARTRGCAVMALSPIVRRGPPDRTVDAESPDRSFRADYESTATVFALRLQFTPGGRRPRSKGHVEGGVDEDRERQRPGALDDQSGDQSAGRNGGHHGQRRTCEIGTRVRRAEADGLRHERATDSQAGSQPVEHRAAVGHFLHRTVGDRQDQCRDERDWVGELQADVSEERFREQRPEQETARRDDDRGNAPRRRAGCASAGRGRSRRRACGACAATDRPARRPRPTLPVSTARAATAGRCTTRRRLAARPAEAACPRPGSGRPEARPRPARGGNGTATMPGARSRAQPGRRTGRTARTRPRRSRRPRSARPRSPAADPRPVGPTRPFSARVRQGRHWVLVRLVAWLRRVGHHAAAVAPSAEGFAVLRLRVLVAGIALLVAACSTPILAPASPSPSPTMAPPPTIAPSAPTLGVPADDGARIVSVDRLSERMVDLLIDSPAVGPVQVRLLLPVGFSKESVGKGATTTYPSLYLLTAVAGNTPTGPPTPMSRPGPRRRTCSWSCREPARRPSTAGTRTGRGVARQAGRSGRRSTSTSCRSSWSATGRPGRTEPSPGFPWVATARSSTRNGTPASSRRPRRTAACST